MRSHSFLQSLVAAVVLVSGAAANVTSPPRVTTVVVESTVTTCPTPAPPPPPCSSDDIDSTHTQTKTTTVTIKPPPSYSHTFVWPSTKSWPTVTVTGKPSGSSSTGAPSGHPSGHPSGSPPDESSVPASSVSVSPSGHPSGHPSGSSSSYPPDESSVPASSVSVSPSGHPSGHPSSGPSSSATGSSTSASSTPASSASSIPSSSPTSKPASSSAPSSSASSSSPISSLPPKPTPPGCNDYWLDSVKHQGLAPFGGSGYKVFRNVKDYGAKGDGTTDDTVAINKAISDGNRCGPGCTGSTTTPALVYFPPGTYLVKAPIIDYYYTQIIGNPLCMPVIKADSSFRARWLLDTNPYQSTGSLAWGSTNVFFRQVANLILDLTAVRADLEVAGVHWPSSQATSLANIVFKLSRATGNKHQGLFIEEGSGGYVGDLVIDGGAQGLQVGNQQFTMRNLTIRNAHTAVKQQWSWGWTYQGISIDKCQVGFDLTAVDPNTNQLSVGSVTIFDTDISNTPVGVTFGNSTVNVPKVSNNIILENVRLINVPVAVKGPSGTVLEGSTGVKSIGAWGRNYARAGQFAPPSRPAQLTAGTDYYTRSKPSYAEYPASSFLSARSAGAKGDGIADDTVALNKLFATAAATGKIVYLDAGYYRVTSTVKIPPGSRITGEAFPIILSSGSFFADASNPKPVVQIGSSGEVGSVEWSNAVVSTKGAQAGAILIEYNLASPLGAPTGLWDVHVRIGGFAGSDLQLAECAKTPEIEITKDNIPKQCISGFLSVHITKKSSGLLMENCWVWVADHDLEIGADNKQISVFAGRGMLIESENGGVWLYGTGVEHHQLYEYQLFNTQAVVMGQIQTETAYYQPNPDATIPFAVEASWNDPVYAKGESGLGLRVKASDGVRVYGAGLYSFFDNYNVSCSQIGVGGEGKCQKRIFSVEDECDITVYNLNTVGTRKMITEEGKDVADWENYIDGFVSTVLVYPYGLLADAKGA